MEASTWWLVESSRDSCAIVEAESRQRSLSARNRAKAASSPAPGDISKGRESFSRISNVGDPAICTFPMDCFKRFIKDKSSVTNRSI
jgi:hypothetical protein